MKKRVTSSTAWAVVAALVFANGAMAQSSDAAIGQRLADSLCQGCHQVQANTATTSPNADAPPFAAIARMPSMTDLAIRVFLRSSHRAMPNFLLSETEIDGVIAYLRSLNR